MANPRINTTGYTHPQETNLLNVHKAMEYNANGQPVVRVSIGNESVTITGNVYIPGNIEVFSTPENPVHSHITEVGTSGILSVPWLPIAGNVTVDNFPTNVRITDMPGITGNVHIYGNIGGSDQPITVNQGTSPWVVTGNVTTTFANANISISGTTTVAFDGTNTDAFGRLRVSNPYTLFDSSFRYTDTDKWNYVVTGSASQAYNANTKVIDMTVSANGASVVRETKCVFQYQPGKSLLILNTFSFATLTAGLRQRVGYFGARNGVYFEADGTTLNLVIRKDITGTVDDTTEKIPQSAWNGDRLDGLGGANNLSGILLNPTIAQIFWTDVEWLGVGSVRCGFVINGQYVVCHTFNHANNSVLSLATPYMATASLPLRYEIASTGGGTGTMHQICSSIISEGGYEPKAIFDAYGMGVATKNLSVAGTYYTMLSIRLNSARLDSIIRLAQLQSMITTATSTPKNCYFQMLKNCTLTGANWQTHSRGSVDYDTSATAYSGGTLVTSGYFSSTNKINLGDVTDFNFQLGRTIGGVSDTITIVVTPDSNNLDVALELGWYDLSQ